MKILAIETSCDETSLAIVDVKDGYKKKGIPRIKVEKNIVLSQVKIHSEFGGVVPNLAKREHTSNLPIIFNKISGGKADQMMKKIDLVAVTVGPGLEPALWTGITFARDLSKKYGKKLVGGSHLQGHLYSFLLHKKFKSPDPAIFPAIGLIVSGGHTLLVLMKNLLNYKKIGETMDDAVGESFDKVARLLNLPYPGGPEIEKEAKKGDPKAISFPLPMVNQKNYNFSYSGLKTAVLYYLKNLGSNKNNFSFSPSKNKLSQKTKEDTAASFQRAALGVIAIKTARAVKEFGAKSIIVGGGVAANKNLKKLLSDRIKDGRLKTDIFIPPLKYCQDNAAMIALSAYFNLKQKKVIKLEAKGDLNL